MTLSFKQEAAYRVIVECGEAERGLVIMTYSVMMNPSLVPRPFYRPVFDRLLYAKTEGEDLVSFIT